MPVSRHNIHGMTVCRQIDPSNDLLRADITTDAASIDREVSQTLRRVVHGIVSIGGNPKIMDHHRTAVEGYGRLQYMSDTFKRIVHGNVWAQPLR